MPKRSLTIALPTLGISSSTPGEYIDPRATPRSQNIQVWRGLLEKRRGGAALGASLGERVLALPAFVRDGAQYILRLGPTKMESWDGSAWNDIADTAGGASDGDVISVAYPLYSGHKIVAWTNGVDVIQVYDGTTQGILAGSPPKAKFLLNFSGYLFALNTTEGGNAFPSRIRWPDAGDITAWASGDAGAKDLLDDDQQITGAGLFGQFMAIHKETAIYLGSLTGTSTILRVDRREAPGTVAGNTIVHLPTGEQAYLSREGIRTFNGVNAPLISSPINEELRETMSAKYLYRSFGIVVSSLDEAWFGIPIGDRSDPDTIFKYNYFTKQIYKDTRPNASMMGTFEKTDQASWDSDPEPWDSDTTRWDSLTDLALARRVLTGYSPGQTIERTDSANDDGAAVDAQHETKDFTAADFQLDDPEGLAMEWQGIEVVGRGTSVDVSFSTDEGQNYTFIKTMMLSSDWPTDSDPQIGCFLAFGSKCRFRFSNALVGGSFSLKQIRPIAVPREGRQ